jgi:hypothetical protein
MPPNDAQLEQQRASFIAAHALVNQFAATYGQAALYSTPEGQALIDMATQVQDTPVTSYPSTYPTPTVPTTTGLVLAPPIVSDGYPGDLTAEGFPPPQYPTDPTDPVFTPPTGAPPIDDVDTGAPAPPIAPPASGSGMGLGLLALGGLLAFTLSRKRT